MSLMRRSDGETEAYFEGFNSAIEMVARRLEAANDETSRLCLIEAIRAMKQGHRPAEPQTINEGLPESYMPWSTTSMIWKRVE